MENVFYFLLLGVLVVFIFIMLCILLTYLLFSKNKDPYSYPQQLPYYNMYNYSPYMMVQPYQPQMMPYNNKHLINHKNRVQLVQEI